MKFHYVYRVTSLVESKHYYGSRTSLKPPVEDIGIEYFTSTTDKKFKKEFKNNPSQFKLKIISEHRTREEALFYEIKLHTRFKVDKNPNFYNRARVTSTGFCTEGITPTQETREKMSIAQTGKILSEETKLKISKSGKGKKRSEDSKLRYSKAKKGRVASDETKLKLSKAAKGKPWTEARRLAQINKN